MSTNKISEKICPNCSGNDTKCDIMEYREEIRICKQCGTRYVVKYETVVRSVEILKKSTVAK